MDPLGDSYIGQHISMPDGSVYEFRISVEYLASLMKRFIPTDSQRNLKIHLLSCSGYLLTTNLMNYLHSKGFKKTCVVGYTGTVTTVRRRNSICEFSTKDRKIIERWENGLHFHHGKKLLENK